MQLYKFVKDRELKQNHTLTYYDSHLKEVTSRVELSGGMSIPNNLFKSIFIFGFKGIHERSHKKIDKVDISHTIEGDEVPRIIYFVYKLGQPLYGTKYNKEETIEGQSSMIERLFTKSKKYPKFHHKSVHHQFMCYACIEIDNNSYKWPNVFLVGEQELKLYSLSQDLERWSCLDRHDQQAVKVKNSNAYLKLKTIPLQISNEKVMIYAYLNSIKNSECKKCLHDWTLLELWELLECKKTYSNNDDKEKVLDDKGHKLQSKYKSCGLWLYYFPTTTFIQKTSSKNDNMYSSCLKWLLDFI